LTTRVDDVDAKIIGMNWNTTQRGDSVDSQQSIVPNEQKKV
jgi:hypothetical protein